MMHGIDLFAGAGGLSLGAKLAGIDVRFAFEKDAAACATYRKNHTNTECISYDLSKRLPNLPQMAGRKLILFGGPPCQGFSTSNQKTRNSKNENNWLFKKFFRFVHSLSPRYFVLENVGGILQTEGGLFVTQIKKIADQLGYQTTILDLDAQHFGIPQRRRRVFIIGHKSNLRFDLKPFESIRVVTVRQAISDLPHLKVGSMDASLGYRGKSPSLYATSLRRNLTECDGHVVSQNASHVVERYKHVPEGGNWESIPKHMMTSYADASRCHTGIYRRLEWDKPSIVIGNFRKNMLIHPSENRGLSVREAARLQSFPDSYCFQGSIGKQQQQVGNAVPPLLAYAVFKSLLQC
jgi:DNA (cytosine-5)-methyltransferase 1